MAKPAAFVLPEGLELEISEDGSLSIRHPGDVHLGSDAGRTLADVHSGGTIEVGVPAVSGTLSADNIDV